MKNFLFCLFKIFLCFLWFSVAALIIYFGVVCHPQKSVATGYPDSGVFGYLAAPFVILGIACLCLERRKN